MKTFVSKIGLVLMGLSLVACGANSESAKEAEKTVEITHELGTVSVPVNPKKIAVLDLAALDVIDALGVGETVAGIPKKSKVDHLMKYNDNENIVHLGSLKEIDMEGLQALQPEVIVIGGRQQSSYEEFSKIAPTIYYQVDHTEGYMNSVTRQATNLAKMYEKEDQLAKTIDSYNSRLAKIKESVDGETGITGMISSKSLSTLGEGSRGSLIYSETGLVNEAADVKSTHGDAASFEILLEKNPKYIFVIDRDAAIATEGAQLAKEIMDNEIVNKTDAAQNDNIIYLTSSVWYLAEGGLSATDIMIKDLETGLLK